MLDLMMIMITGLGTPLLVSFPYLKQFDYAKARFPLYLYEDETWLTAIKYDLRMVFISSSSNLISQLSLAITLLLCFSDAKALVLRNQIHESRISRSSVMNWKWNLTQSEETRNRALVVFFLLN